MGRKIPDFPPLNERVHIPNKELWDLAINGEPTIFAYLQKWQASDVPYVEMLEKLVIHLAKQKKDYYEQVLGYIHKYGVEPSEETT